MRSAIEYVKLAERTSGPIPRPVEFDYVWGDAFAEWARVQPDVRIINLENAVTTSEDAQIERGIHYRMHPKNLPCLTVAAIDCCVLANNHVMDWGPDGLIETITSLRRAGIQTAGAGRNAREAGEPAVIVVPGKGRVLVFAWGVPSSGVPSSWAADQYHPGINLLSSLTPETVKDISRQVRSMKKPGDVAVASLHWGGNWGYAIWPHERAFARQLVDEAGIDIVHGHSSHHVKGIEVYRDRPILYGCGDLLNDYEGIGGNEEFRANLGLLYFPTIDATTGSMTNFHMAPTQKHRFRIRRADQQATAWLASVLSREGHLFGTRALPDPEGLLNLQWK
jgi:poly-gamma-glutamate synthesis protein (capsule biosynthesis protein)